MAKVSIKQQYTIVCEDFWPPNSGRDSQYSANVYSGVIALGDSGCGISNRVTVEQAKKLIDVLQTFIKEEE